MAKKKVARPRAQHKRVTKADQLRAVFGKLSQEDLADKSALAAAVKKARIKTNDSDVYRIRNEFLTNGVVSSGSGDGGDVLRQILLVKKTAEQVGGLSNLKQMVNMIERVQQ